MPKITDILDGKGDVSTPCPELFGLLFKSVEDAHITHLVQPDKSYATHMALNTYYDAMPDILDTLIETYKVFYPLENIQIPECGKIIDVEKYFSNLYNKIEKVKPSLKEGFLVDQIHLIQQEIAHCLYRVKFTK